MDTIKLSREITQIVIDGYVSEYTPWHCGYISCLDNSMEYKHISNLYLCKYCPFYTDIRLTNIHKIH